MKLSDMNRTFLEIHGQQPARLLTANAGKKTKKNATARKNSNATAHCTHLPLLAHTQAPPKAKSKECNRQRFISSFIEYFPFSISIFALCI
jgi:hypothetical protein